jgi:5-methylcytosine-specific restriction enzyme subunit McrC
MHRKNDIILFEFGNEHLFDGNIEGLKNYLAEIWANRNRFYSYNDEQEDENLQQSTKQGFLRFDGSQISARNYVGFIFYEGQRITILPKLFRDIPLTNQNNFHYHLLYWLSYCSRVRFPFAEVKLDNIDFDDLLEVFIFIFAGYSNELLSRQLYYCYEEVTENVSAFRGHLSMNNHINTNVITGNWQNFYCTYEPFELNNSFNQIIKYTCKKLLSITNNDLNIEKLEQSLFILNDVDDKYCIYSDCHKVKLNYLQSDWRYVLDMCKMFLSGQSVGNNSHDNNNFCFLVPMEYVFEDFIFEFINSHMPKAQAKYHSNGTYLTDQRIFQIEPDILCKNPDLIIDTKYKIRQDNGDGKQGVSQNDLYQMLAYAVRKNIKDVYLFYPSNKPKPREKSKPDYTITSPLFTIADKVNISLFDVCIYYNNPKELENMLKFELGSILK